MKRTSSGNLTTVCSAQAINPTGDVKPPCSFAKAMYSSRMGTIKLNSGFVILDLDLHIDTHKEELVQYRRVISCAPLNMEGYVEDGWVPRMNNGLNLPGEPRV